MKNKVYDFAVYARRSLKDNHSLENVNTILNHPDVYNEDLSDDLREVAFYQAGHAIETLKIQIRLLQEIRQNTRRRSAPISRQ